MTERFECDKGSRIIIDNETKLHYIMTLDWECSLVTKLLNSFAEENEQLKHKVNCLQDRLDDYVMVEKENEQLKSKLTDCNEAVWSWSKSYNRVYEENEQLKQNIGIILKYCRDKGKYAMDMKEMKAHNILQRIVNELKGDVE